MWMMTALERLHPVRDYERATESLDIHGQMRVFSFHNNEC